MRFLLCACLVACVVMTAGFAGAATPGQVPDNTLAMIGLSGIQPMTDVQGTEVRGMGGTAVVYGTEVATAPIGVVALNGYYAKGTGYYASAAGVAGSLAVSGIGGSSGSFIVAGSIAVGGAYATAK